MSHLPVTSLKHTDTNVQILHGLWNAVFVYWSLTWCVL